MLPDEAIIASIINGHRTTVDLILGDQTKHAAIETVTPVVAYCQQHSPGHLFNIEIGTAAISQIQLCLPCSENFGIDAAR